MSERATTQSPSLEVRVERVFNAPADAVFEGFTNPEVMKRWWHANAAWSTPIVEQDLRVGGDLRLTMRSDEGPEYTANGVYTEISPPERLAFTWQWDDESSADEMSLTPESAILVEFSETDGQTTVILTHTGFTTEDSRTGHESGWGHCLENLETKVFPEEGR